MASKYKIFPMKTLKDWEGEDWVVFEEHQTQVGLPLYKGRIYGETYGHYAVILTKELADFIKNSDLKLAELALSLCISKDILARFKRRLNIQRKMHIPDYDWIYAHQDELFSESFQTLHEKFGLTEKQVQGYVVHLRKCKGISRTQSRRKLHRVVERENFFWQHQNEITHCNSIVELADQLDVRIDVAREVHLRMCKEKKLPTTGDRRSQRKIERIQGLLDKQDLILCSTQTVKSIALQLNMTVAQVTKARKLLRDLLSIHIEKKLPDYAWIEQHQEELMSLKKKQLQELFQITAGQVDYRRNLLKRMKKDIK